MAPKYTSLDDDLHRYLVEHGSRQDDVERHARGAMHEGQDPRGLHEAGHVEGRDEVGGRSFAEFDGEVSDGLRRGRHPRRGRSAA